MTNRKHLFRTLLLLAVVFLVLIPVGGALYYEAGGGSACARCHEIRPAVDAWANSTHRSVPCRDCHGGLFTAHLGVQWSHLRQLVQHWRGHVPPRIMVSRQQDVEYLTAQCQRCHREEDTAWRASLHSATYADIFLNKEHNTEEKLTNECFLCHGMFFQGNIGQLVTPLNQKGPWKLKQPALSRKPATPCLACHQIHRPGKPLAPRIQEPAPPAITQPISHPSLALYDPRTRRYRPLAKMRLPRILEGKRVVKMSPDPRQALCYQCHAPDPGNQAGTGDDRTPIGVHEGISCLACHDHHSQQTRASCAECHPRLSNCGRDVETMDTTFKNPASKHNIHTVKCIDCHPKGVPPRKKRAEGATRAEGSRAQYPGG